MNTGVGGGRPGLALGSERVICFCPHQQGQRPATELDALCRESGCKKDKGHFRLQPVLGGGSSEAPQCRVADTGLCCRPALAPSDSLPW